MHTTSQSCAYSVYHIHSISITMVYSQNNMLSHLMNHVHFTYELCNTHNYSIILKIILTRRVPTVDLIIIFVILKGSYNCVIAQFIAHNSIHRSQYACISSSSQVQFVTYSQFKSQFYKLNVTVYTKCFLQHEE